MKETLQKAYDILNLIASGIRYCGTTADNTQKFTIEVSKNSAMIIAPEGLVTAIGEIRDELGIELHQPAKVTSTDERLDPAARLYQQMLALDPAKAASVSKIKTNGSSTEATFAAYPVFGGFDLALSKTSMEVTPVERTTECEGNGTVSTT